MAAAERIVASVLAQAGPRSIDQIELESLLVESGVRIVISELRDAPYILTEWDLIEPAEEGHRFRVELLRRWIAEKKPVSRVQQELDRIEPLADNLYLAGNAFYQNGQLEDAINDLRRSLAINPNHLQSGLLLAQIYLEQRDLDEAVSLLDTIYEYNPGAARPRLVQAYREGRLTDALQAYEKAGLKDKVAEVEQQLRAQELLALKTDAENLEEQKEPDAAPLKAVII